MAYCVLITFQANSWKPIGKYILSHRLDEFLGNLQLQRPLPHVFLVLWFDLSIFEQIYYADQESSGTSTRFLSATLSFSGTTPVASVPKSFLSGEFVGAPQGLAMDWISRLVYWTSLDRTSGAAALQVARLDGSHRQVVYRHDLHTTLGHVTLDARRGLVLHSLLVVHGCA